MHNNTSKIFNVQSVSPVCTKVPSVKRPNKRNQVYSFKHSKSRTVLKKAWNVKSVRNLKSDDEVDSSGIDGFYGILALVICTMACFTITLLPAHNAITNPEYWYEIVFSLSLWLLFNGITHAIVAEGILNPFNQKLATVIINLLIPFVITGILGICLLHLIWSTFLGYFEPFPCRWWLIAYLCLLVLFIRLWNEFPRQRRRNPTFRNQCKNYICLVLWILVMTVQLNAISAVFGKVPLEFQWLFSLILPVTKELNDYIVDKLITKSAFPENINRAKFIGKIATNLSYSFWLAIILATKATQATSFVLLAINFCIDMSLCYKAIWLDRRRRKHDFTAEMKQSLKEQAITELILNEAVEVMVPIAFIGSFSSAYFGPNKDILGDVGCSIWQYQKVENIHALFMPVVEMAIIDSGSVLLAGALLWNFCHINIFKEYCRAIKKYWVYLACLGGSFLNTVSITKLISFFN